MKDDDYIFMYRLGNRTNEAKFNNQRIGKRNIRTLFHKKSLRDFPAGPVIKTPCSQCRGHRFGPWLGN